MKIAIANDQTTVSCTSVSSSLAKPNTSTIIKVCIAIVLVTVICVIGWQIHTNIAAKNDNHSSKSSSLHVNVIETNYNQSFTAPPTISATSSPIHDSIISESVFRFTKFDIFEFANIFVNQRLEKESVANGK